MVNMNKIYIFQVWYAIKISMKYVEFFRERMQICTYISVGSMMQATDEKGRTNIKINLFNQIFTI